MMPLLAGKDARAGVARAGDDARHRPEQTLLYQLVEQYYPAFVTHLAARERTLPAHVEREFDDYLRCGRLEHGFLRVRCADCHSERLVAGPESVPCRASSSASSATSWAVNLRGKPSLGAA